MSKLSGKTILLIIGGGIAAYKSLELIRLLKNSGSRVRVIMTQAAKEFVAPLTVASLAGEQVHDDLFNRNDEIEMGHIELSRAADLLVVAPATADLMAKMAQGHADDLASTTLLATDKKVLIAPAMNVRMWQHGATARNLAQLLADGVLVAGPNEGEMACGEFGPGRMAEPAEILAAIENVLSPAPSLLAGKKVLVTAGPTREAIDPVRYISNHSSGKQGYAIAAAAARLGAEVALVSGPVHIAAAAGVRRIDVVSAADMLAACEQELPCDIAIFAAAVADWRTGDAAAQKIKKTPGTQPSLTLVENPDILRLIARPGPQRPKLVVGFAAETENIMANARDKLTRKGCDLIIANDVGKDAKVFDGEQNSVHLVSAAGIESWGLLGKQEIGTRLMAQLAAQLIAKP